MKYLLFLLATAALAGPTHIYVANSGGDNITIIDPSNDQVSGEIKVSRNPHGIVPSPDGKRFYISSEGQDVLDVVDRATSQVIKRVPLGPRPNNLAITPDGRRVYICIRDESWVDIVDTTTLEKVKSVPVGRNPHNIYMSPDGQRMIATSMGDNKLTVIEIKTEQPEFEIPVGGVPRPLVIEAGTDHVPHRLFVQLSDLHGFAVVNYAARKVVDTVKLPEAPKGARPLIPATFSHGIAIAPDGKTLWVTSLLDNSVSVYTLPGIKYVGTTPVGRGPDWMVFTPDGRRCYVSNAGSDSVSVLDAATRKELHRINVGKVPKRIIAAD